MRAPKEMADAAAAWVRASSSWKKRSSGGRLAADSTGAWELKKTKRKGNFSSAVVFAGSAATFACRHEASWSPSVCRRA